MRVLLVGAAGSIGRCLLTGLAELGHEPVGVDLVPAPAGHDGPWHTVDVSDPDAALARYYLGVCYRGLDNRRDAARVWQQCAATAKWPEGIAAAYALAELHLAEPALEPQQGLGAPGDVAPADAFHSKFQ